MNVIRNEAAGTLTIVPTTARVEKVIKTLIPRMNIGDRIRYGGRAVVQSSTKKWVLYLHAGGRIVTRSRGRHSSERYVDSTCLALRGASPEVDQEIRLVRDVCYYGSGLTYLGSSVVNGRMSLVTTGRHCKLCQAPVIDFPSVEWKICSSCAANCLHEYEDGVIHGGGLDIGVGVFCGICGRMKPKEEGEQEPTFVEHLTAVTRDYGIKVILRK